MTITTRSGIGGGVCGTLTAACGISTACGSFYVLEENMDKQIFPAAIRGRKNGQNLELNGTQCSNALTTVGKDFVTVEINMAKMLPIDRQRRIRKVTPKECFRLMGMSDEDFEKAKSVNSDSQLFKQAGNSIVVPVLEALFRQLNIKNVEPWNK